MWNRKGYSLLSDPFFFGLCFLGLIPLFALIYIFVGSDKFTGGLHSYIDFVYFSSVTVSTLGFGDVSPTTDLSRFLVSCQVILGLTFAGMFLNACSYKLSERSAEEEKRRQMQYAAKAKFEERKARLLNQHAIVGFRLEKFAIRLWALTCPRNQRGDFSYDKVMGLNGETARDFKFSDLRDLHQPTLFLRDSFSASIVSYFYKELGFLAESIKGLLNFSDLQDWPKLQADCLRFLGAIEHLDYSESILHYEKVAKNDEGFQRMIIDELVNASDEPPKMRGSDVIDSYVALFYLAKSCVVFGREYVENIDEIMSSSYP